MAVEFISYGYDTAPGAGLSETTWEEMFPEIGLASMGVRNPGDWKVTGVSGADRTVSIAAGRGWSHGVIDKTVANDTIQLDPVAGPNGTVRWDLIVCRRDPTPSAGVSKFEKISGGATPVIPGGRLAGPGIRDQPLALVPVIAGQTQPGTIIDLRTWAGDGGALIAKDELVKSFLNQTGTRLHINGSDWIRRPGDNDVPEWFCPTEPVIYAPVGATNWSVTGDISVLPAGSKRQVTLDVVVRRTGPAFSLGASAWEYIVPLIPDAIKKGAGAKYPPILITAGNNHVLASAKVNPNGGLDIRSATGEAYGFTTNALFTLNFSYFI